VFLSSGIENIHINICGNGIIRSIRMYRLSWKCLGLGWHCFVNIIEHITSFSLTRCIECPWVWSTSWRIGGATRRSSSGRHTCNLTVAGSHPGRGTVA